MGGARLTSVEYGRWLMDVDTVRRAKDWEHLKNVRLRASKAFVDQFMPRGSYLRATETTGVAGGNM